MEVNPNYPANIPPKSQTQINEDRVPESKIRQWLGEHVFVAKRDLEKMGMDIAGPAPENYEKYMKETTQGNQQIVDKIFPVFQKLNEQFPEALKLILSKSPEDLKIKITDCPLCTGWSSYNYTAWTLHKNNDRAAIYIYQEFCNDKLRFKDGVLHELMHEIDNFAIKDSPGSLEGIKLMSMHGKETSEALKRLAVQLNQKKKQADAELLNLKSTSKNKLKELEERVFKPEPPSKFSPDETAELEGSKKDVLEQAQAVSSREPDFSGLDSELTSLNTKYLDLGLEAICASENEYKEKLKEKKELASKFKLSWSVVGFYEEETKTYIISSILPKNESEIFAEGLVAYLDKERRYLLKQEEPELYRLIEEVIIPKIKERARELE